jgi:sulfur carrier protein
MTDMTTAIQVNGKFEPLLTATLSGLLTDKGIDVSGRGVAVAVNGAVVPRAAWPRTALHPGDAVEIVAAKQGG